MSYYFVFILGERVATAGFPKGSNTCVCKAETEEEARAQLLPEMREKVVCVLRKHTMTACYRKSERVLDELAY